MVPVPLRKESAVGHDFALLNNRTAIMRDE